MKYGLDGYSGYGQVNTPNNGLERDGLFDLEWNQGRFTAPRESRVDTRTNGSA
jgi:hypothetical protein